MIHATLMCLFGGFVWEGQAKAEAQKRSQEQVVADALRRAQVAPPTFYPQKLSLEPSTQN